MEDKEEIGGGLFHFVLLTRSRLTSGVYDTKKIYMNGSFSSVKLIIRWQWTNWN